MAASSKEEVMYKEMTVSEMSKLPGIADLKTAVKVKFIKALKAEEEGAYKEAEAFLAEAVLADETGK